MEKEDVVFLCQFFYPEFITSAKLPYEIAEHFVSRGYSVGALCGYPKEYSHDHHCPHKETVNQIKIKRIRYIHTKRNKMIGRAINIFSFTLSSFLNLRTLRRYKCVFVLSDPPVLPVVALVAKRLFKIKVVFVAYDIFPEIAHATNSINHRSFFAKFMRNLNKRLHMNVSGIIALTDEMKHFLVNHRGNINPERISVIPNWATDPFKPVKTPAAYRRFGYYEGQFIVSYFGNMGVCQDIETLMAAAIALKYDNRIRFLFAGHGAKREFVANQIKDNDLRNVQISEYLDGEDYDMALSISSCCVVSLQKGLIGTCAPSKYYSYLQAGRPILSIGENESYLGQEVMRESIGRTAESYDVASVVREIRYLLEHEEEREQMAKNAHNLYLREYDRPVSLKKYGDVLETVLNET